MLKKILCYSVLLLVIPTAALTQVMFPTGIGTLNDLNTLHPVNILHPCDTCRNSVVFNEDEEFANRLKFYYQRLRPEDSIVYYHKALGNYLKSNIALEIPQKQTPLDRVKLTP